MSPSTGYSSAAPVDELRGEVEIAYIVADHILGSTGAVVVSLIPAGILISTVSAMILAGPRALQRLGEDYPRFSLLGRRNTDGLPAPAISVLGGHGTGLSLVRDLEQILIVAGLLMAVNTLYRRHVHQSPSRPGRRRNRPLHHAPISVARTGFFGGHRLDRAVFGPGLSTKVLAVAVALLLGVPLYRWAGAEHPVP